MREVAGAILILAGSILFAASVIADAVKRNQFDTTRGYVLGMIVGLAGVAIMSSRAVGRSWDTLPGDEEPVASPSTGSAG